ncbi:proline iminopeptidase-family hydrolase [Sandarakinorhabdus oryzae]|uniref:proline iminopeptidase-family hydrolase n=1 Tax=Sandarakinorhabdus oryzae TaxID=2675220 RepID=UPI001F2873F3|nr:proline iminopeptidase-family hydrolase [Sandarakinorhabdus oryzae]
MMGRRTFLAAGLASLVPARLAAQALPQGATASGIRIAPDREAMVPVQGGRIYVRVNGALDGRKPPILFIHGGPGSSHWGWLNATALADERAVILYDQLDCGRSDRPGDPANWTVERFLSEIEAIRAHFGIARWHLLGGSWGGTLALEYGASRPAALAGLVLQSPLVSTSIWLEDAALLKAGMPDEVRDLLDRCDTQGAAPEAACQAATDAFYAAHVRQTIPPPAITAYRDALPAPFAAGLYNHMWGRAEFTCTGTLKDYDGRPLLTKLDAARTLFVAGTDDEARPETVARFAETAGAQFVEIPNAAHSIMLDNPATYLAVLRGWMKVMD